TAYSSSRSKTGSSGMGPPKNSSTVWPRPRTSGRKGPSIVWPRSRTSGRPEEPLDRPDPLLDVVAQGLLQRPRRREARIPLEAAGRDRHLAVSIDPALHLLLTAAQDELGAAVFRLHAQDREPLGLDLPAHLPEGVAPGDDAHKVLAGHPELVPVGNDLEGRADLLEAN